MTLRKEKNVKWCVPRHSKAKVAAKAMERRAEKAHRQYSKKLCTEKSE